MNTERLLISAQIMDEVQARPDLQYDQSFWMKPDFEKINAAFPSKEPIQLLPPEDFCGTTACWLGQCALSDKLPGLVVLGSWSGRVPRLHIGLVADEEAGPYRKTDTEAAAEFFGIPEDHAMVLTADYADQEDGFYHWSENLPASRDAQARDVASALRRYVETDGEILEAYMREHRE